MNYVLGSNKSYVVKEDQTVDVRDVTVGERFPQEVEIVEGLNDGEQVAMSNLNRLETGSKVRIAEPTPAAASAKED